MPQRALSMQMHQFQIADLTRKALEKRLNTGFLLTRRPMLLGAISEALSFALLALPGRASALSITKGMCEDVRWDCTEVCDCCT